MKKNKNSFFKKSFMTIFAVALFTIPVFSQVNINVNLNVKHKTGWSENFDRQKFINFHSTNDQKNWTTDNKSSNLIGDLLGSKDVRVGRNTGGISWPLKSTITEDPNRPGYADPASIAKQGKLSRESYASKTWAHPYESKNKQILCTQPHPFYPDGKETSKGWSFSQKDTDSEPFGTASGEFYGRFINEYYGAGGTTGQPKPGFVEVVNEPLWDIVDKTNNPDEITNVFKFHSTVAKQV